MPIKYAQLKYYELHIVLLIVKSSRGIVPSLREISASREYLRIILMFFMN